MTMLRLFLFAVSVTCLMLVGRAVLKLLVMALTAALIPGADGPLPTARVGRTSRPRVEIDWDNLTVALCTLLFAGPIAVFFGALFIWVAAWSSDSTPVITLQCIATGTVIAIILRRWRRRASWGW